MNSPPRTLFAACLLISGLMLSACGGSAGSSDNGSDNGGSDGGNIASDASMSHPATPIPVNVLNPQGTPLFSDVGRMQALTTPGDLAVVFEAVENQGGDTGENCRALGAQFGSCSVSNLHLKDSAGSLNDGNWKLYFHSIRRILRIDSNEFVGSFVNGDLHFIEPGPDFEGFDGNVKTIKLITEFNHLVESDFMPRYWLVRDGQAPLLIANTDEETNEGAYAAPFFRCLATAATELASHFRSSEQLHELRRYCGSIEH